MKLYEIGMKLYEIRVDIGIFIRKNLQNVFFDL